MKVPKLARLGLIPLLASLIWAFWFFEASDNGDRGVAGTYVVQWDGGSSNLVLRPDHSFQQEVNRSGTVEHAKGNWSVIGEGHVALSREFLFLGQEVSSNGTSYGQFKNSFGLCTISFNPSPIGPKFHKKLFR
jgi:hypothetical protein